LSLGDNYTHKLGKSTLLTQTFLFYPGLTKSTIDIPGGLTESVREYRGSFSLGTVTKLNKWLGWQNSFGDVFVTHPPVVAPGTPRIERNDIQFATGINVSFSH
jgi:carbohydrate-selective porin OprB